MGQQEGRRARRGDGDPERYGVCVRSYGAGGFGGCVWEERACVEEGRGRIGIVGESAVSVPVCFRRLLCCVCSVFLIVICMGKK